MTIQTQVLVETPENIDLQAVPAGLVPRILAYSIDLIIKVIVQMVLAMVLFFMGLAGMGILLICYFLLEWFYPVFFEMFYGGQTPGKKQLGLVVVHDDLTPIAWGTSIIRNLLRAADSLPLFYFFGLFSMLLTKHFQRLGDLAAGTLVIYQQPEARARQLPEVDAHPPPAALDRDDQIAIIGFTHRHEQISGDRQQELADILAPMLPVEGRHRIAYLHGIGRWLLGGQ
ncbi:MAG: RDD family protein [Cellvibrionaceae bacterium]